MTIAAEILTILKAEGGQFFSEVDHAVASTEKLSTASDKMATVGKVAFLTLGAAAIAGGTLAVHAAQEYETAHLRLVNAIKNSGSTWDQQKEKVEKVDSQLRKLGFTDTETETALTTLTQVTKDTGKATELMGLAADISAGKHISLGAAVGILSKVEQGRISGLARLNIDIKDNEGRMIGQEEALRRLAATYGGAASDQAGTFAGKLKVLEAELDHVAVTVGEAIIPVLLDMVSTGADVIDFFQQNQEVAIALAAVIGGPLAIAMATFIAQQIKLGAVWVFDRIKDALDFFESLAEDVFTLSSELGIGTNAAAAHAEAQYGDAIATQAAAQSKLEAALAEQALAAANVEGAGTAEAGVVAEAELVLANQALTVSATEAAAAEQALAVAEAEAIAAAGIGGLGILIGAAVLLTGAVIGAAYALGYFDDNVSAATVSGEKFGNALADSVTQTKTTVEGYRALVQQQKEYSKQQELSENVTLRGALAGQQFTDKLSLQRAALLGTSTAQTVALRSQQNWRQEAELSIASHERTAGVLSALKGHIDQLKPAYDKAIKAQKEATAAAVETAAVFSLTLPKGFDGTTAQTKALTQAMEPLKTLIGVDAAQAVLNLANSLPDLGTALLGASKQSAAFASSLEGSISKFTDVFGTFKFSQDALDKFGVDAQAQFHHFFVTTQLDAAAWADEITDLIHRGVDRGLIDEIAKAGPAAKGNLDLFLNEVNTFGVDAINKTAGFAQQAAKVTEQAYNDMAVHAAVKALEVAEVGKAAFQDLQTGGTANLEKLLLNSDKNMAAMAYGAILQIGGIKNSLDSIPDIKSITFQAGTAEADAAIAALHDKLQEITGHPWQVVVNVLNGLDNITGAQPSPGHY